MNRFSPDIWYFTVIWTIIFYGIVWFSAGLWAYLMFFKAHTFKWYILFLIPVLFVIVGSVTAFLSGSVVGKLLRRRFFAEERREERPKIKHTWVAKPNRC